MLPTLQEHGVMLTAIRAALSDAKGGILERPPPQEGKLQEKIEPDEDSIIPPAPLEILQLIFRLYCQSFNLPDGLNTGMYDNESPIDTFPVFTLMQVCSEWRQLVLKTPEFWSVVSANDHPRDLALARRWLSRAGSLPRTLSIALRTGYSSLTAVYHLISMYPFRTLRFDVYLKNQFVDFTKIRLESLLPLERLAISCHSYGGPDIGMTFHPHTFPNLSWLQIHGSFEILRIKTIPWPNLLQLDLNCTRPLSLSESLTILRDATALERAAMVVSLSKQKPLVGDVFAANLSALDVKFCRSCNVGHFLDMLIAPKLKVLDLDNYYYPEVMDCDISVLQRLVASSEIEMEKLCISQTTMPLSVGALLDCMPSLRRLELRTGSLLDEDSMKRIANGGLGPCLEALTICVELVNPEAAAPILTMVTSRQNLPRSEYQRNSYFKQVQIQVVGMEYGYVLSDYVERLGELKGIVKFN